MNQPRQKFLQMLKNRTTKYSNTYPNKPPTKIVTVAYATGVLAKLQLQNIPYAILGGQALALHGYNRTTQDIDVLVNPNDIPAIIQSLNIQRTTPLTIGGVAGFLPDGTEIDLVSPNVAWLGEAISNAQNSAGGRVITKPYVVLAKLWASRGAQEDVDIIQMIKRMNDTELQQTKTLIQQYLPNDSEDLEQLIEMKDYL